MFTKSLIGIQAVTRILLIPVSIVTMSLNLMGIWYLWKFQQKHEQAQSGIGVPRYHAIGKDRTALLQLQTAGLLSLLVAIFSLSSVSLMGYLHLDPLSRRGIVLMTGFDSTNSVLTLISWVWSAIVWPRDTCIIFSITTLVRHGLVLGCRVSAASVVSMALQWLLFTSALGVSIFLSAVHLQRKKSLGCVHTSRNLELNGDKNEMMSI